MMVFHHLHFYLIIVKLSVHNLKIEVVMADVIQGIVQKVIDGGTFNLKVTGEAPDNQFLYKTIERIKISGTVLPISSTERKIAKMNLEEYLGGQEVFCTVLNRDSYSTIIATVRVFTLV